MMAERPITPRPRRDCSSAPMGSSARPRRGHSAVPTGLPVGYRPNLVPSAPKGRQRSDNACECCRPSGAPTGTRFRGITQCERSCSAVAAVLFAGYRASAVKSLVLLIAVAIGSESLAAEPPVTALAFAPDGSTLLAGSQAGLAQWAWPSLAARSEIAGMPEAIHSLTFTADGDALAVGGGTPAESGRAILLSWPTKSVRWSDRQPDDIVYAMAWSPDGQRLATASLDGVCRVLAAADGKTRCRIEGHSAGLTGLAWVDDAHLITASRDATLRMWSADDGRLVRTLNNHTGEVASVAASPTAQPRPLFVSCGADRTVRFWQPTIGRLVRFAKLEDAQPLCLVWAPDGRWVAAGTTSGNVVVVDPATASIIQSLRVSDGWVTAIAVGRDGRTIAAGSTDGTIVRLRGVDF